MTKHLAVMNRQTIESILTGKKNIETRFSRHKIAPFGVISQGDLVYMKPPGEEIVGQFRVKKVYSFEGLEQKDVEQIFDQFGKKISNGDNEEYDKYKHSKLDSRYATLIFIKESERFITSPIKFKKSDMRGWVVIK